MTEKKLMKEQYEAMQKLHQEICESFSKPWRHGWEHITEEEQLNLREKNKKLHNIRRFECMGTCEDRSDRCDLYDTEGYCRHYGSTWKGEDGVFRGGMDAKLITDWYTKNHQRKTNQQFYESTSYGAIATVDGILKRERRI